jgi:hypothetical protein
MSARRRLLVQVYDAFNARDLEGMARAFHPQVEWPDLLEGGALHGRQTVIDYFRRQFALMQPDARIIDITPVGADQAIVHVQYAVRGALGGLWSDTQARLRFTFEDGLIRRMAIVHGM